MRVSGRALSESDSVGAQPGAIKALNIKFTGSPVASDSALLASGLQFHRHGFLISIFTGNSVEFRQSIQNARDAMERGAPRQLVDVTALPLLMTAESYLDKYGPQEKYNTSSCLMVFIANRFYLWRS